MAEAYIKAPAHRVGLKTLEDGDLELSFVIPMKNQYAVREGVKAIREAKPEAVSLEVRKQTKKRSLDANAYCWALLERLAEVLGRSKDDLYREYIKSVGVYRDFHLLPEEAESLRTAWGLLGTGWITEQVDYTPDGEHLLIRAYYGSSRYNSKQMARLIDSIVEDCKDQGIETLTPSELASMKEAWGRAEGKP